MAEVHGKVLLGEQPETPLQKIFNALATKQIGCVQASFLESFLAHNGLTRDDPRMGTFFKRIDSMPDGDLGIHDFLQACESCSSLIHGCVSDTLRVKDFASIKEVIEEVYKIVEPNKGGENASYIPQLAKVDPEQFSISITTVDGQHFSIGDSDKQFCIQSCCKPLNYLIARRCFQDQPGYVHNCVGKEPSGVKFNEMVLKPVGHQVSGGEGSAGRAIPHNPMINAGAIMCTSMVYPNDRKEKRLDKVLDFWRELCGITEQEKGKREAEQTIRVDWETYQSESRTADRNWCLGYMMNERKSWPDCFHGLSETLELYFQTCSILNTNRNMAHMAATLANGGINPFTGQQVVQESYIRNVLPLMLTCGMYDYSGEWVYDVGVPAKSGVGGCVFMVIPNVCGISVWSPRLDENGNSVRGVHVAKELVKRLVMHAYEVSSGLSQTKIDMKLPKGTAKIKRIGQLLFAASTGDEGKVQEAMNAGIDLWEGDYDHRTALHLAVCEGHESIVRLLVEHGTTKQLNMEDRWGGTALDDAIVFKRDLIASILRAAGAREGSHTNFQSSTQGETDMEPLHEAPHILYAAAENDIHQLVKFSASDNFHLKCCDYDLRTPLHLAAAENHDEAAQYLLTQLGDDIKFVKDRWGNTAVDDAAEGSLLKPHPGVKGEVSLAKHQSEISGIKE